jgi:hypothetical protein
MHSAELAAEAAIPNLHPAIIEDNAAGVPERCNPKRILAAPRLCQLNQRAERSPLSFVYGENSLGNSTDTKVSGECGRASNSRFHSTLAFSKAVRAPYAAMSSYSIARNKGPVSGRGTVLRQRQIDFGITLLVNWGDAAACSFAKKSGIRPGLTSYLKIARTAMSSPCRMRSAYARTRPICRTSLRKSGANTSTVRHIS